MADVKMRWASSTWGKHASAFRLELWGIKRRCFFCQENLLIKFYQFIQYVPVFLIKRFLSSWAQNRLLLSKAATEILQVGYLKHAQIRYITEQLATCAISAFTVVQSLPQLQNNPPHDYCRTLRHNASVLFSVYPMKKNLRKRRKDRKETYLWNPYWISTTATQLGHL